MSAQLPYAVELPTRPIVLVEAKPAEDAESEMRGGQAVVESTPAQIITLRRGSKRPVEIVRAPVKGKLLPEEQPGNHGAGNKDGEVESKYRPRKPHAWPGKKTIDPVWLGSRPRTKFTLRNAIWKFVGL